MAIVKPTKVDLYRVYGSDNIDAWADANNTRNTEEKEARITEAVDDAYRYVVGRLAKRYDISKFATLPEEIFKLISRRAGIELYEAPRGIVDGDSATAQLNAMSLKVEAKIDQILSGQLVLLDIAQTDGGAPVVHPAIVNSTACIPNDALHGVTHNEQWDGLPRILSDYAPFYLE